MRSRSLVRDVRWFLGLNALQHARWKIVDSPKEAGDGPQFLLRIKRAVGGHGGVADTVFHDPIQFGLGVLRADLRELRDAWIVVEILAGLAGFAVAAEAAVEIKFPALHHGSHNLVLRRRLNT